MFAIFAHLRRGEAKVIAFTAILFLAAVFIAVFRFTGL
ncbi:hypothetical protein ESP51_10230 [Agromyces albus]|uniref:Uncharacterized protein n=1 Tax=Agromyces albus TaxID=205332 RepID=A0A4Q2KXA0_9MICO|nr:hypothetical protein ESP51_10230 [Agromyces albus]